MIPLLLATLTACSPPPYTSPDTGSLDPGILVTWPLPETEAIGCTVVTVEVKNFTLVDFTTHTTDVPGEGHYHVVTPLGYTAVWTPYALISFETIEDTLDNLSVEMVNNLHEPIMDPDGDGYEYRVPLHFMPGECAEFGAAPTDTNYDTGMAR